MLIEPLNLSAIGVARGHGERRIHAVTEKWGVQVDGLTLQRGRRRLDIYWSLPREIVIVDSLLVRIQRMSSRR